jgi:hypothetical protein
MMFEEQSLFIVRIRNTQIESVPHRKHSVSVIEPNRLMLFGETIAVYCENHTEHTDTVRTSQETHYVSTTEPNRLMLFTVRTIRNTQIQCVGRMQFFNATAGNACSESIRASHTSDPRI